MANFDKYYPKLEQHEGGYMSSEVAKKARDAGGETYKGITRNFHPDWAGWVIIDRYKKKFGKIKFNSKINDKQLDDLVKDFARSEYWDYYELDDFENQSVAELIADFGYNSGRSTVIKAVQRLVDLPTDGRIGQTDLKTINKADQARLHNLLKTARIRLITNSTKISPKAKPELLARANTFIYSNAA